MAGELKALCAQLVERAEKLETENASLRAAYKKIDRQLCDALDGIAELKLKLREQVQLNEELRDLPVPTRKAANT